MRRLLSAAFAMLVCAAALVLGAANDDSGSSKTYRIIFDNAFGITEGGDFRVGGVRAGETSKLEATDDTPPKASVTAEISVPGFDDFRTDAQCEIKPQSLIGEYFVDCQPGEASQKIPDGGVVPVENTSSTIPQDLVNNILRTPYRERLRLILTELGTGLAGRPEDLQEVLRRAHPGLRETQRTLQILGNQNRVIEDFITSSDTVVAQLEAKKTEVSRFIEEAGQTAEVTATRRADLRETFRKFPGFLAELRPTMARLEGLADQQIPLLRDARRAAPSLDRFLARLGPFAEASRPAVRSLAASSEVGTRAFNRGTEEVAELRKLARNAPPTARPLRQFLESLDDRRRAIDQDPRAQIDGPAAGDPSLNNGGRGGFTGLESALTYPFWQSLSFNSFDNLGHVLRLGLTITECSEYENRTPLRIADPAEREELEEKLEKCNQWLGPNQPGVTTADPTVSSAGAARLRRDAGAPAGRAGERRGPGEPDAGPVAGQRDISKPQITLPPQLQELLDSLPDLTRAGAPAAGDRSNSLAPGAAPRSAAPGETGAAPRSEQLLDYLLAP